MDPAFSDDELKDAHGDVMFAVPVLPEGAVAEVDG